MTVLIWILAGLMGVILALVLWTRLEAGYAERQVPPLGHFVQISAARLHVAEEGSGPPIILIHGLGAQMRSLTWPLSSRLSDDFHVIGVDRPGSGYSERGPDLATGLEGDAAAISELIRSRGLERPLIVGHSLGGAVALAMAVHHPGLYRGLALVAPLTRMVGQAPDVFRILEIYSSTLRSALSVTVAVPAVRFLQNRMLREIFHPEPVHPDFGTHGGGLLSRRPSSFRTASSDLLAIPQHLEPVEEGFGSISIPTSILYGRDDRILDPQVHGVPMRERVPGCEVELVDGGHMLPVTQPDRVSRFIRDADLRARA